MSDEASYITADDLILLEREAERAKAERISARIRAASYEENRFSFCREVFFGSYFHTEKTMAWLGKIRTELNQLRARDGR